MVHPAGEPPQMSRCECSDAVRWAAQTSACAAQLTSCIGKSACAIQVRPEPLAGIQPGMDAPAGPTVRLWISKPGPGPEISRATPVTWIGFGLGLRTSTTTALVAWPATPTMAGPISTIV
jgi:hypothetical protein